MANDTSVNRLGSVSIGGISIEADSNGSKAGCHSSLGSPGNPESLGWESRILTNKVVPQRPVPIIKTGRVSLTPKTLPVLPTDLQAALNALLLNGN